MRRINFSYPGILLSLFMVEWLWLALHPVSRSDWLLENLLVHIFIPILVFTYRQFRFSNAAYSCMALFFALHVIGAHYTYSLVPYDDWWRWLFGTTITESFGFSRNHFDRLVHLLYGALIVVPAGEFLAKIAPSRGFWGWLLPILFVASHSVIYEVIEWVAAVVLGGDLGQAYLGTQGDEWDAQKDMALAIVGATCGISLRLGLGASRPVRA